MAKRRHTLRGPAPHSDRGRPLIGIASAAAEGSSRSIDGGNLPPDRQAKGEAAGAVEASATKDAKPVTEPSTPDRPPTLNEVYEAASYCLYKARLLLTGQRGTVCDYERMCQRVREDTRQRVQEQLARRAGADGIARNVALTRSLLGQGKTVLLNVCLPHGLGTLHVDILKKIGGSSRLGPFHYMPLLVYGGRRSRKEQKAVLDLCGLMLSQLQGQMPVKGGIYGGTDGRLSTIRLTTDPAKAGRVLDEIRRLRDASEPPPLLLNDHCHTCEFRQRCHDLAAEQGNLSLLGIGSKEIRSYARKGILTLAQLAHTFRPRRAGKRVQRAKRRYYALQAMALRDKRVYILGTPTLPASKVQVYLDLEGDPEEGYVYLIGMLVCDGTSERPYAFWADSPDQETRMLQEFLRVIHQYPDYDVFCYGGYERAFLKRIRSKARGKAQIDRLLGSLTNVLSLVYSHIYFPCYTNGLKDVAGYLGYSWSDSSASGIQSIVWRREWQTTQSEALKQKLIAYNRDDCYALKAVVDFLYATASGTATAADAPAGHTSADGPAVTWVRDIDRLSDMHKWGDVSFFHPDYKYVNDCAYFDYQRQRVYVRTSKTIRRSVAKARSQRRHNRALRVTRQIEIKGKRCPACKGTDVILLGKPAQTPARKPRAKRAFDLAITPGGIKRRVIEARTSVYQCRRCGEMFIPPAYGQLARHFHGVTSWAMFLHVEYRLSFKIIEQMFEEFFGLRIGDPEIYRFKDLLAQQYRGSYRRLMSKMLTGRVLHVDETEVKLRTGKGYVWVFATPEEVIYTYRPTRECGFLQDQLKGFQGVLVSDFYSGYDSLACPQQKCLIHLMRDMNQDLLNNPFDRELQSITERFGRLLRSIVATIDEHGLRQRFLRRHERDAKQFLQEVSAGRFQSETAQNLRDRLVRHQQKLFTFLRYDGVSWNNNNAENAIKRFAYYRQDTAGTMTEAGLGDYLVLLSLCHSCRYRGVSFLKFLLSRQRDLDVYCQNPGRRHRAPGIQLYPKGFLPLEARWSQKKNTQAETAKDP